MRKHGISQRMMKNANYVCGQPSIVVNSNETDTDSVSIKDEPNWTLIYTKEVNIWQHLKDEKYLSMYKCVPIKILCQNVQHCLRCLINIQNT